MIKINNKIAHSRNLLRISFFKWYVKEAVVAAIFMLERNLFKPLYQDMRYVFVLCLFYKVVCPVPSGCNLVL